MNDNRPICPSCKSRIADGAVLCVHCGLDFRTGQVIIDHSVGSNSVVATRISRRSPKPTKIVRLSLLAATVAIVFAVGWVKIAGPRIERWRVERAYAQGVAILTGKSTPPESTRAVNLFKFAAERGHAGAQYELGKAYFLGQGVIQNKPTAIEWFQKSSNQGFVVAQRKLGDIYQDGAGVPVDITQAIHWYTLAANQGDPDSMMHLGLIYYYGLGVPQDYNLAAPWLSTMAGNGNSDAQYLMGMMCRLGQHFAQDDQRAFQLFLSSAKSNNTNAQLNVAMMYRTGTGVAKDPVQAAHWLIEVANKAHDTELEYAVGKLYWDGSGVRKDHAIAANWFQKAAKKGHADSQIQLGFMFYEGDGVAKDYEQAINWLSIPAEKGDIEAQRNLGAIYVNETNAPMSYVWFRKAAEQGDGLSELIVGQMLSSGTGVATNNQEAVLWFRKSAEQGIPAAEYALGLRYLSGIVVETNQSSALHWLRLASEHGHELARVYVSGYEWSRLMKLLSPDTVTLTNSEVIRCEIVDTTKTNISISVANYNRTVFHTQNIPTAAIQKVEREAPEQKPARIKCENLLRFKLDPDQEQTTNVYNQTISEFTKYLSDYPHSIYVPGINALIGDWRHELDNTSKGLVKYHCQWMEPPEKERQFRIDQLRIADQKQISEKEKQRVAAARIAKAKEGLEIAQHALEKMRSETANIQAGSGLYNGRQVVEFETKKLEQKVAFYQEQLADESKLQSTMGSARGIVLYGNVDAISEQISRSGANGTWIIPNSSGYRMSPISQTFGAGEYGALINRGGINW